LLLSFLFSAFTAFCEPDEAFIRRLEQASGTEKARLYNELAAQILNNDPESSIDYAIKALELAVEHQDIALEADAAFNIGNGYRLKGENLHALDYYLKALKAYPEIDDKEGVSKSSAKCGMIYRLMGDYSTALDYHTRSLRNYKELNLPAGIAQAMIDIGISYMNLDKPDIALDYYNKALETIGATNNADIRVSALIAKGNILWEKGENDKALEHFQEALTLMESDDFTGKDPADIYDNIGNVYRHKDEFRKALEFYNTSLSISEKIGDKNQMAVTYKNMGITYKLSGRYSMAVNYLNRSRKIGEETRQLALLKETLEQLSDTYALLGNYKSSLQYYKEFTELKESLYNKATHDKISIMQLGHALKDEAQKQTIHEVDLNMKVLKERNIRNIIIFVTLLSIGLIFILWSRFKLKTKTNQELVALNTELEQRVEERTKRLHEENERRKVAQENAEIANETKNRFLANISHEVRTPINAIIGFCDLTEKTEVTTEQRNNLQRIKDSSEHLLALIKDVMDYSQIENGKTKLKPVAVHLKDTLDSVVNAFYLDAKSKQIDISINMENNVPDAVRADRDALRQILFNLVGNAVKFTEKGKVIVGVSAEKGNGKPQHVRLRFSVKDSGIGISKLKQKLIFMDFTQEHDSSTRKYGGAGLGLTISKYFVELMEGKIWVESEKGKGSEFIFTVNLQEDNSKTEKPAKLTTKPAKNLHILIAEDNLLNAQVIVAFLNRLGHSSKVAANGIEALKLLAEEDFDAVLMDIEMPEMDGLDATRAIRKGKNKVKNPKIPVVALTAHALQDYEEKSYAAGMDNYLTKPVDINHLSDVLREVTLKN
jgi:signal transduction histidine kinase/ActR/RegA family two-component response regulator